VIETTHIFYIYITEREVGVKVFCLAEYLIFGSVASWPHKLPCSHTLLWPPSTGQITSPLPAAVAFECRSPRISIPRAAAQVGLSPCCSSRFPPWSDGQFLSVSQLARNNTDNNKSHRKHE